MADFARQEEEVLKLWESKDVFKRSISQRKDAGAKDYIFYDGPPFATGLPHYGHMVASTIKDVVARYWTMRGRTIERRFGWDTHGLPIEMETEKKLNLSGPGSIREYGIDKFNEACRSSVLTHTAEWRKTLTRLGRWVDFDNDYKTMDPTFMESVWWVFGELWKKGLVYKGNRVMPYSYRLSTSLSNFEANLDYRDVQDPALTVKLKLRGLDNTKEKFLLIWTTTPWTLPSNLAVAVGKDIDYVEFEFENGIYIAAKGLVNKLLGPKASYEILKELKGSELVGLKYESLFDYFKDESCFVVVDSDHVSTESGTGLVHMAPAFGQEDFDVCQKNGLPLFDPVDEEGNFTDLVPDYAGQNIKEADPKIIKDLKSLDKIFKHDTIQHSYPFCWRSGTPLIYKAMPVWFVSVSRLREKLVENNKSIHWVPGAVGQKRFGNWLKDAQDWGISRSRFWGTPIPIWLCSNRECDEKVCVSSVEQLEKLSGEKVSDLHSHFIDDLTWGCADSNSGSKCSGQMARIKDVFDCWFDAGSMPYAQRHYPFEADTKDAFDNNFPADFIAEGLDQTRGWFYTLLVLSTALFDKPPFQNVIVNGMVLASDGSKMSKSKKNYPDPNKVLDELSADALRAYLINSPVVRAEPLAFTEAGVKEIVRMVMLPLNSAWQNFYAQYAKIDGFDPKADLKKAPPIKDRKEIDRWILSKLQSLVEEVNTQMNGYYLYKVIPPMLSFIDDLTNWYIRQSRRRFWKNADDAAAKQDKLAAYATLYEVLLTFSKVLAPALPFVTERIYQDLAVKTGLASEEHDSVHLCDYPKAEKALIDKDLESAVELTRQIVKMGRALRERKKLKVKQPLSTLTIVTHFEAEQKAVLDHKAVIQDELNIKNIEVLEHDDDLCELQFKPNFKTLGRRMGKNMRAASEEISKISHDDYRALEAGGNIKICDQDLTLEDIIINRKSKEGLAVETQGHMTIGLDTELTEDLVLEGLMREVLSALQNLRKEKGYEVSDRINLRLASSDEKLNKVLLKYQEHIGREVLAKNISLDLDESSQEVNVLEINGLELKITVTKLE